MDQSLRGSRRQDYDLDQNCPDAPSPAQNDGQTFAKRTNAHKFDQDQSRALGEWSPRGLWHSAAEGQRPWSIARYRARRSSTVRRPARVTHSTRCAFRSTTQITVRNLDRKSTRLNSS